MSKPTPEREKEIRERHAEAPSVDDCDACALLALLDDARTALTTATQRAEAAEAALRTARVDALREAAASWRAQHGAGLLPEWLDALAEAVHDWRAWGERCAQMGAARVEDERRLDATELAQAMESAGPPPWSVGEMREWVRDVVNAARFRTQSPLVQVPGGMSETDLDAVLARVGPPPAPVQEATVGASPDPSLDPANAREFALEVAARAVLRNIPRPEAFPGAKELRAAIEMPDPFERKPVRS